MNLLPKFKEYLFSQSKPSSKVTVKNYTSDVIRFIKWFEDKFNSFSPELITPEIIEQFKESSSLTASSLERNLSSLRKFFSFLKLEGYIDHSPFELITDNSSLITADPYRLKAFKDYLYVYNASKLTIKNYLMDVKGFLKWTEEVTNSKNAWDIKEKDILRRIDNYLIEEYKRRLLASLEPWRSGPYAPRTINRKLSSLRKYLKWAEEEGLIRSERLTTLQDDARLSNIPIKGTFRSLSEIRLLSSSRKQKDLGSSFSSPSSGQPLFAYSKFPPLRLIQKILRSVVFIPEFILVNPLASLARSAEHLIWKLRGKPVFNKIKNQKSKIKSLPKEVFAPFAISTKYMPFHRKLIFHLTHTRPQWYKRYHQYSFSHYFHLAILMVFMSVIGFGIYQNIYPKSQNQAVLGFANPQIPPRILSFQGRLTDSSDNPITSSTNLRFALYDSPTGTGSALLWQEIDTVAPDSDGIFSLLLGNRTTMSQSLFAERAGLWLGVTVGQTAELTPRQRLATVAYAENADNLQGLPPITQSGAGQTNVVLALDSSGNLTIGGTATPTFQATGGKFTVSGNVLALTTTAGSKSDVQIIPASQGLIDLQRPIRNTSKNNNIATALGAVEFDDLVAILATSSGQSALTINQNDAGPLISASSSGTAKFTLSNAGAGTFADDLAINGGDITSTQTTFNLLNATVTTLNVGGAATTINLGATSGTTTTANSLTILGNTTLGDTAADTITLTGALNSNFLPDANNTRNLGSSSLRFGTVFGVNGDFTNIAGTVTGGSTSSSSWTINSDNATANAEVGSLAFETGTANFNAVLQWNASGDAGRISGFDNTNLFNFPVGIFSQVSGANQSFTSGTLFKYGQPTAHAITQSAAFIGTDYDFSTNITVPNSASGNQTGYKTTLKDGGASATAIGFQTAGTLDFGLDIGGTIGTAEIRLSNGETITNTTDGTVSILGADIAVTAGKGLDVASAGILGVGNTTATTVNIGNTAATTLTLGSAGSLTRTISIGTGTGADTINIGTGTVTADTISIGGLSTTVLATTGTLTHTGTANINNSGSATTAIGNSTGSLTLASGGTSSWTNTSGNLTIQTATSGTLVLDSAGAINIGNTNATSLSIGRTGVTTTNNGALTSTQTLTASNGLTLTTGALNLTATSGSTSITGYGTTSITSTTASGNILTLADASFTTTGANLANLTFTNTNAGAGAVTTNGLSITPTGTAITGGGSNTLNAINLPNVTAITSNTFNGINIGTGYNNLINSANFTVTAAGAVTAVGVNSGSGLIQGTGGLTITGTVSLPNDSITAANISQGTAGQLLLSNTTPDTAWTTLSGDATLAGTGALTLANSGVTANTYGSSTAIPVITVDAKGRLTTVTTASISSAWSAITDPTTNLSLSMGANTTTFTYNAATGANNLFTLIDTASNTGTGYLLSANTASLSNLKPFQVQSRGNTIIDTTATGGVTIGNSTSAQAVTVDAGTATLNLGNSNSAKTINVGTGTAADTINIGTGGTTGDTINIGGISGTTINITGGTVNVTGNVVSTGTVQGTQLISTVAQGTAPLTVTSTTVVANLNAAAAQQPNPNLVLNSDFSRRNKWMTFMPEVFADTSGLTVLRGNAPSVASNTLTNGGTPGASEQHYAEGLTTWRDARFSAQGKLPTGTSVRMGVTKVADADNFVAANLMSTSNILELYKVIAGVATVVATAAYTPTAGNWYWVELESQGTTYIARVYSSGASPVAKPTSAAATVSGTISDAAVATGRIGIRTNGNETVAGQWGGLSTGDGGVYVEGWGPESWTVELNGTKGGQAIGFDEAADSGPIEKQWAMRAYIPATSRNIEVYQDTPDGSVLASTSYISSMYLKTSGKGGSGSLVRLQFQRMNSAITQQGSTTVDDAGETSWTRVNSGAITTETGTRRARIRAHINASGTATGTGLFLLPQLEQGSVATPWRNAPADDGPITWYLTRQTGLNITTTSTSAVEVDSRDLAVNTFLPWDANVTTEYNWNWYSGAAGNPSLNSDVTVGGTASDVLASMEQNTAGFRVPAAGSYTKAVSAGKSRVAVRFWSPSGNTIQIVQGGFVANMQVTASRGKFDLAEEYSVNDPTIEAGDVVRLSPNLPEAERLNLSRGSTSNLVEKTDKGYDSAVLGIVSTDPGITLGNFNLNAGGTISSELNYNERYSRTNLRPVALSGRVPVKVTSENGRIKRGDILTSSATLPGYAMKATRAGRSIGIAMENFDGGQVEAGGSISTLEDGSLNNQTSTIQPQDLTSTVNPQSSNVKTGKVLTFVNLSFYDPDVYLADTGQLVIQKTPTQIDLISNSPNLPNQSPITNYQLLNNNTRETIERIGAFKDLFVANLKVGSLDFSEIKGFGKLCVQSQSPSDFGLVKNTCSQTTIEKVTDSATYAVKTYFGEVVTGGQILAEAVVGNLRAGFIQTSELLADTINVNNKIISPIAEVQLVKTDIITPLSSDKIVIKLEDHSATPSATSIPKLEVQNASGSAVASIDDGGNASFSGQLSSKSLNSEEATVSGTLRTKNLIAENIESSILNLKSSILNLETFSASPSAVTLSASESAILANVDTLQAQVGTFMQGLFAVGPSSLSDATVFGQLSIGGNLILADSSINVLGTDLQIQPLGQGGVSFLAGKVIIDSKGNLEVNGDAKFNGTLFAGVVSPIPGNDLVFKLLNKNASGSAKFLVQNASGSAVLSVNNKGDITASGSARFNDLLAKTFSIVRSAQADTSLNETIASSSAGFATITAGELERTIITPFVKENSLIYITPTSDTQGQTPYISRQTLEDLTLGTKASFTIGISKPVDFDIKLNWWIVN